MGLDYLNKKVWHPGSMKNIQKVWQEEQKQKQINKKNRERNKKLLEQQHNEELKRIQVQAGLIPRSHLERMDWMYDWGNKLQQQKTNEEYLTGEKAANPGEKKQNKHVFQEQITNRKCQDFSFLHEDPMFEIQKVQKQRKDAIMNNPIEMRSIIREAERSYLPHDYQERKKKTSKSINYRKKTPNSSSSQSRSRSREKNQKKESKSDKKGFKQSKVYQDYLKSKFGNILKEQDGRLKPDYSTHKSKYRTQYQLDVEQRRKKEQQLRDNVQRMHKIRSAALQRDDSSEGQNTLKYDTGLANIRKNMLNGVKDKHNRNHKKHKYSDED